MPPASKEKQLTTQDQIFLASYLRIWQILGDRKRGIEPILPIGRTTFLDGVKSGKFPQPVKLGVRTVAWKASEIMALVESFGGAV
jgi:predicted DNA-binding transcriptional regulator AlpA